MKLNEIQHYWNLIANNAFSELKAEGTRTYAGYLWWIFEPLMSLAVYYVAFKYILHRGTENFALFLFAGVVAYRFFSGTVSRCARSLIVNSKLMQQVYVHKSFFPLSIVLVNFVKYMVALALVICVFSIAGFPPTLAYIWLPVLILLHLIVVGGISILCAAITPFFPDFQNILTTILHLMIFLSGVFFDITKLSPQLQQLVRLNPLATLIAEYREVLLSGKFPEIQQLIFVLFQGLIFTFIGWWLINKFNKIYPKIS